jgi:hypothetical protein
LHQFRKEISQWMILANGAVHISRDLTLQKAARATNLFTAFATEAVDFALMDRVTIVSPFLPTDIQLLHQKSLLCQLQSRFRGELSIVGPAVGHDFLVLGQNRDELRQFFHWGTHCAWNVSVDEGRSTAGVEEYEIEDSPFDRVQNIVSLLFGAELMSEIVAVGANFISTESHACLLIVV